MYIYIYINGIDGIEMGYFSGMMIQMGETDSPFVDYEPVS